MRRPRAVPEDLALALALGQMLFRCIGQVLHPFSVISIRLLFDLCCSMAVSFKAAVPDTGKAMHPEAWKKVCAKWRWVWQLDCEISFQRTS